MPEFIVAFQELARLATKAGVEGRGLEIHAPLIYWTKAQIIREGRRLGVDFGLTVSCYRADAQGRACGRCDSCRRVLQSGIGHCGRRLGGERRDARGLPIDAATWEYVRVSPYGIDASACHTVSGVAAI